MCYVSCLLTLCHFDHKDYIMDSRCSDLLPNSITKGNLYATAKGSSICSEFD